MSILIQPTDFKGYNELATNNVSVITLQAYIDKWEKYYLYLLFGKVLADLFIASIANWQPVGARYLTVFNAFHEQQGRKQYISEGIKSMLISFIEYHYVSETQANHGQAGVNANVAEVTEESSQSDAYRFGERKFNNALETYDSIQWYMRSFAVSTYPEYLGSCVKPKCSFLL